MACYHFHVPKKQKKEKKFFLRDPIWTGSPDPKSDALPICHGGKRGLGKNTTVYKRNFWLLSIFRMLVKHWFFFILGAYSKQTEFPSQVCCPSKDGSNAAILVCKFLLERREEAMRHQIYIALASDYRFEDSSLMQNCKILLISIAVTISNWWNTL